MPLIPTVAVVQYNGISFDASLRSKVNSEFVYDAAGRTVTRVDYTFEFSGRILSPTDAFGDFAGTDLNALRTALSKPGGHFKYMNNGFGDLEVNGDSTTIRDVNWGPKPKVLSLRPQAFGVWSLDFTITVSVPQCDNARWQQALMEFNYGIKMRYDAQGYVTIIYSGHIEIPMTRAAVDSRTMPDHVDAYREWVVPQLRTGFVRTHEFDFSLDKRRMEFTVVDTQTRGELPAECIDAEGSQETACQGNNSIIFNTTISATYTLSPRADKKLAMVYFMALVKDRLPLGEAGREGKKGLIVKGFKCRESFYRDANIISFSCQAQLTSSIQSFIVDAGHFSPIPLIDSAAWKTSASIIESQGPRGLSNIRLRPEDDFLIDLCYGADNPSTGGDDGDDGADPEGDESEDSLSFNIDPETSWLDWDNRLTWTESPGVVRHRPLSKLPTDTVDEMRTAVGLGSDQVDPVNDSPAIDGVYDDTLADEVLPDWNGDSEYDPSAGSISDEEFPAQDADTVQRRSGSSYRIVMRGYGIRAGLDVPIPRMKSIGDAQLVEDEGSTYEANTIIANWGGVPIFRSRWKVIYICDRPPVGKLPVLYNPAMRN